MAINIHDVEITHPNKVLFPCGVSKLDLIRYYELIFDQMLPYIKKRPVTLLRSPNGIKQGVFYQRHPQENFPDYIDRVKVYSHHDYDTYISIDELKDILFLVNIGVIEFHTWACKQDSLDFIDYGVLDLDPGKNIVFPDIVKLAYRIYDVVEKFYTDFSDIKVKTSGKKGLHISLFFKKKTLWPEGKRIIKEIASRLVKKYPNLYTIDVRKEARHGKIFIDYLRNYKGSTTVAPYSVRAWKCASISMPVEWEQLEKITSADQFTIREVIQHTSG